MFIEFFTRITYAKKINPNKCQFQCFVLFHRDTRVIEIMIRFDRCFVAYFHFPPHFWIFIFVSIRIIETIFFFCFFLNLLRLLKHFFGLIYETWILWLLFFTFKFFSQFLPLFIWKQILFEIKETHSNPFNFYFQIEISIEELMT